MTIPLRERLGALQERDFRRSTWIGILALPSVWAIRREDPLPAPSAA